MGGNSRAITYRGPGQLAEHLEMAWALLNWRRAKGRTRTKVWGREWRQAEGFVKIVMPNLGRLSPAKAWPASPSRGAPGFFSSSFGALCAWAAATFFFSSLVPQVFRDEEPLRPLIPTVFLSCSSA